MAEEVKVNLIVYFKNGIIVNEIACFETVEKAFDEITNLKNHFRSIWLKRISCGRFSWGMMEAESSEVMAIKFEDMEGNQWQE